MENIPEAFGIEKLPVAPKAKISVEDRDPLADEGMDNVHGLVDKLKLGQ